MKAIPLIFAAWIVVPCPSWAVDNQDRFIEFPGDNSAMTYDLSTVQLFQPGRFTIISTVIDNPDVMKFELTVFDTLRAYCTRPDGKYPAPAKLFTLGPPDMPVKSINVENNKKYQTRTVDWDYPYKRLAFETTGGLEERPFIPLHCESPKISKSDVTRLTLEARSVITNGTRAKYLFDCKRGMMSLPIFEESDTTNAQMFFAQGGRLRIYVSVCYKVMHESPFLPESPKAPNEKGQPDVK